MRWRVRTWSRQVFRRMVKLLAGEPTFTSNAPKFVEVLKWQKDGADYFAVINEQEESPIAPMYDITIDVKAPGKRAYLLPDGGGIADGGSGRYAADPSAEAGSVPYAGSEIKDFRDERDHGKDRGNCR